MILQENTTLQNKELKLMEKPMNLNIEQKSKVSFKNYLKIFRKQKYLQAMCLPGVVWMIVFCYIPMGGLIIAFKDYSIINPIFKAPWVGLKYFSEFIHDENFINVMQNTFGISLLKLLFGFPLPIIFALFLNELISTRFKRIIQTISYLPHFLSWAVLGGIMINWFSDIGVFNGVLMSLGLIKHPITFLAESKYFWSISVGSDLWKELGWNAIIYLAAITAVDVELYESADLDGAGRFGKMWNITLPCIKGTMVILFIINVGYLLNTNFDQIFVLQNQLNLDRSNVIDLFVYRMGIQSGRFSYAAAIGLFRSLIALVLVVTTNLGAKKLTGETLY
jgi:putative aldouronate transport system permease protein